MACVIEVPDLDNLIARYKSGTSMKKLSSETNIGRNVLQNRFEAAGVEIRGRSDAEKLKWVAIKRDPAAVRRQCGKAWDAVRGRIVPRSVLCQSAKTRHERQLFIHRGENEIADSLRNSGFSVDQQFPMNGYSIDITIPEFRIAVEVVGSNWHPHNAATILQKTKHVLSEHWFVLFVLIWRREPGIVRRSNLPHDPTFRAKPVFAPDLITDYIVTLTHHPSGTESILGKYWMISGNAEPLPTPRGYLDGLPRVGES